MLRRRRRRRQRPPPRQPPSAWSVVPVPEQVTRGGRAPVLIVGRAVTWSRFRPEHHSRRPSPAGAAPAAVRVTDMVTRTAARDLHRDPGPPRRMDPPRLPRRRPPPPSRAVLPTLSQARVAIPSLRSHGALSSGPCLSTQPRRPRHDWRPRNTQL